MKLPNPNLAPSEDGGTGGAGPMGDPRGMDRRSAALSQRGELLSREDDQPVLDPANQSLAEAIGIAFLILQVAMLALFVLYIFSGATYIKEGERGIALLFGRKQAANLEPGFRFSAPYPLGEVVRVSTGVREVRIDDVFWVDTPAGTPRDTSVEKLSPSSSLKPSDKHGSILTADGSIAHARVSARYRHDDAPTYAENVLPDPMAEERLVRLMVQRGVVIAAANSSIDDFTKQSTSGSGTVADRAKAIAQDMLARIKSGIAIDSLTIESPMPPLFIRTEFAGVQTAKSKASKAIEEANGEAKRILNEAAGQAAPYLMAEIESYEKSTEAQRPARLARIDAILEGRPVKVADAGGENAEREIANLTSGNASELLTEANTFRSQIVAKRKAEADLFRAKLGQFESNPNLMVTMEWAGAYEKFVSRDSVQTLLFPKGINPIQLVLSADPDIQKAINRAIQKRESEEASRRREDQILNRRFETPKTGLTSTPD